MVARFDDLFERRHPSTTPESAALIDPIGASVRAENRAAAAQLTAIGQLFAHRLSRCSETEDWAADTMTAVAAELAAALRISHGLAEAGCTMPGCYVTASEDRCGVRRRGTSTTARSRPSVPTDLITDPDIPGPRACPCWRST